MRDFPPFRLDVINQSLWRRDGAEERRILLSPKAFGMLFFLVERAGRLVTHEELLAALWAGTHVQPEVLKSHIRDIRAALGDDPKNPRFIETLPRRGYRFIALNGKKTSREAYADLPAPKIVGRKAELERLRGSLQQALHGVRQLVFVTGEAGIGKTALVDAFQHRVAAKHANLGIGRGQSVEGYGGKEPYYPVLETLWQLSRGEGQDFMVQVLASHAPTWLVQFPALIKPEQRENLQREIAGAARERMLREIADALETIAAENPVLLVFEDLHWADPSTLDLISALARRRLPAKLMLIATYRPVDADLAEHSLKALKQDLLVHRLCHEISLRPLDAAEVAEYLALESAGAAVPETLAELIYRHSEGNPLFMVAAINQMRERGLVALGNGTWHARVPLQKIEVQVPESLRQMIELRIERLSGQEQRVLEIMSLLRKFPLSLIIGSAVAGIAPERLEEILELLCRRHQVVRRAGFRTYRGGPSPCYEFVHVLYREVLYSRIGPVRRRTLHQSVAENGEALHALPETDVASDLAYHFEQGGDWLRAIKYLCVAADTAGRRFEPSQAAETLEHALQLANKVPEAERTSIEVGVLQRLCTVYSTSFDPRAMPTYERLAERAARYDLPEAEAHALLEMAFPFALVTSDQYLRALDRGLEVQSRGVQRDALRGAAMRALYLSRRMGAGKWESGDLEECRSLVDQLRESLHEFNDRGLFGEVQLGLAYSLFNSSEYRQAHRAAAEGFANFLQGHEYPYLSWHSELHHHLDFSCPLFLGEWGEALGKSEQYIRMVEKNGDRHRAIMARLKRAELQIHALDFSAALQTLESLFPEVASLPYILRKWLIWAGSAEAGLGNHERALEYLLRCRHEMDQRPVVTDWYDRMPLQWALTETCLTNRKQAQVEAAQFLKVTQAGGERTFRSLAFAANARVAMTGGELATARQDIARAVQEMEGGEVSLAAWRVHATAWELYGRTGDRAGAEKHRELSCATIMKLANSLPMDEPLRLTFLSSPSIRMILEEA